MPMLLAAAALRPMPDAAPRPADASAYRPSCSSDTAPSERRRGAPFSGPLSVIHVHRHARALMLALIGIDLATLEERASSNAARPAPRADVSKRHLGHGVCGHEAANEQLERRARAGGRAPRRLLAGGRWHTRRRPRRARRCRTDRRAGRARRSPPPCGRCPRGSSRARNTSSPLPSRRARRRPPRRPRRWPAGRPWRD